MCLASKKKKKKKSPADHPENLETQQSNLFKKRASSVSSVFLIRAAQCYFRNVIGEVNTRRHLYVVDMQKIEELFLTFGKKIPS